MAKTTITEALAEIKTIGKRLDKKKAGITQYLVRDSRVKDPLEKEGGTTEFVKRERQAIHDLEQRIVRIKVTIAQSNLVTSATIGETTHTVAEWIVWRRDVSKDSQGFLTALGNIIKNVRDKIQKEGRKVLVGIDAESKAEKDEVVIHLDEAGLLREQEAIEQTLGDLDGKLSLINATTVIEIPD